MKHSIIKCARWYLQWQGRLICVSAAVLFFVLSAQAQTDEVLPPIGGGGGSGFVARCPQGQFLTGFELQTGDDVDSIKIICVTAYGPTDVGPPVVGGERFGGDGGGPRQLVCPSPRDAPIVIAMYVGYEGLDTRIVNNIHLWCGTAATTQKLSGNPNAVFDGPGAASTNTGVFAGVFGTENHLSHIQQSCPAGLVAVGINGRSGVWLDAVGLICGAPTLTPKPVPPPKPEPVKALGRVKLPPGATPTGPQLSICEYAREARARNSPAAPGLEEKCRAAGAAGEIAPVKALGRVKLPPGTPPNPPSSQSICDLAREARARNSPAAPGLEEKCRADLAAKGAAIAEMDPELAEARVVETDALYRQGFDIATGIFGDPALGAQGNTAAGPGSLKIRDSLSAAGQRGFNDSMKLHLSRNYKP